MWRVSSVLRMLSSTYIVLVLGLVFSGPANAVRLTSISSGPVVVRLCPVKCVQITGHGFSVGRPIAVYETRGGWSRVSGFIDPESLKATFGDKVPAKPAFWLPAGLLGKGNGQKNLIENDSEKVESTSAKNEDADKEKKAKEKKEAKKAKKVARQRSVTIPKFRPGTQIKVASLETSKTPVSTTTDDTSKAKMTDKTSAEAMVKDGTKVMKPDAVKSETAMVKDNQETKNPAKADAPKTSYKAPQPLEKTEDETKAVDPAKPVVTETPVVAKKPVAEDVKVAKVEPTFKSEDPDPLVTEVRPETYIKALNDKRLKKLPGRKSKLYKPGEVVALRHHALMLLKNNECKGIVRGGRSLAQKGMMYVVCTDDPTFLRQFPLKAESW